MTRPTQHPSQRAREAAATLVLKNKSSQHFSDSIRTGEWDDSFWVQAFARFERNILSEHHSRMEELGAALSDRPADVSVTATLKMLEERFAKARCDDAGVAGCIRCNVMHLVRRVRCARAALNGGSDAA